uniref:NFACT protein C-terminal domain-containing protein n=1 Tax=Ditylenchus dipsaci TaxID=166011 RepID=A0A915DWW5_9BILA
MGLLGSVGEPKNKDVLKGKSASIYPPIEKKDVKVIETIRKGEQHENQADEGEVEEEQLPENVQDEQPIVNSLTCSPAMDDGILFSVPVCAPYSFYAKVKVTPGTGKRGKAVKMALALFLRDKTITQAERVLIKSLTMDDHVAQNLPGKVRVSAPQLLNAKFK